MVVDLALRYLTMAKSRTSEESSRAEFEAFYLRTAKKLHGYLCRLSRDAATADEILQEAYIRLLDGRVIPGAEIGEPARRAYLYRTATNLLRDRWRRQKVEQGYWEKEAFSEAVHHNVSTSLDVAGIFEKMSPLDRAALWLAHVEQLSHREMAEILGVKEQSVKVIVFRARAKARDLFERAGFGPRGSMDEETNDG